MKNEITSLYFSYLFWNYYKGLNAFGSQDNLFKQVSKEFAKIADKKKLYKSTFFKIKKLANK